VPEIRRKNVPEKVLRHLLKRIRDREIPTTALQTFAAWADKKPQVPEGKWFKRLPQMIVCGHGELVLTFLTPTQTAVGEEVI
jgi:hypothetical protein